MHGDEKNGLQLEGIDRNWQELTEIDRNWQGLICRNCHELPRINNRHMAIQASLLLLVVNLLT
jgi:hypothetical protein